MTWVIKVLSGKHSGAELEIDKKHFLVGSCPTQVDCVISDSGLDDQSLQITVTKSLLVLKMLSKNTWYLNGRKQSSSISKISPFDVVQVGTVAFTLGPQDQPWPAVQVPPIKRFRFPSSGLIVSGLLCVGSLNASLYFAASDQDNSRSRPPLLYGSGFAESINISQQDKQVLISGYLPDQKSSRQIFSQVRERYDKPIIWRVYRQDQLARSVQTWLSEHNLKDYQVTVGSLGNAIVSGVVPDQLTTPNLSKAIKTDVPGVKKVSFNVTTISELTQWLTKSLKKEGLGQIGVSEYDHQVLLTGQATENQRDQIYTLIHQAASQFGDQVMISYQPVVIPDGVPPNLRAVITSKTPYIELTNGQKYLKDAIIGNGFTIQTISEQGIALSKNGQRIWLSTGDTNAN